MASTFIVRTWLALGWLVLTPQEPTPPLVEALQIEGAVVCRSIEGYEDYEPLPNAELTSDEKLLVYYRPRNYRIIPRGDDFAAHFTQDGRVRELGKKKILLRKDNLMDYEQVARRRPDDIYIQNTVSIKGLAPGEYEYDMILRDENAPALEGDEKERDESRAKSTATATIRFRVVKAKPPGAD